MNHRFTWARPILLPCSWVYGAAVAARDKAFGNGLLRVSRVGVPVIGVGNIVAGGVGKTPLVRHIAEYCLAKGKRPGVVSRGYKRATSGLVEVSRGDGLLVAPDAAGDEAAQIASSHPGVIVVVAEDRVAAARRVVELGAGVVIADDAYQHRYLARDLNILVMDASVDLSDEALLPAGMLREPLTAIRRADMVVLSHDFAEGGSLPRFLEGRAEIPLAGFRFKALPVRRAIMDGNVPVSPGPDNRVVAFSGIGNHEAFLRTVEGAGFAVGTGIRFPDHHRYTSGDFLRIGRAMSESGCRACVTTEKDIARLDRNDPVVAGFLQEQEVLYIPVSIEFTRGASLFHRKVDECLNMQSERKGQ